MNRITAEGREVGVGRGDGSGAREDRAASVSEQRRGWGEGDTGWRKKVQPQSHLFIQSVARMSILGCTQKKTCIMEERVEEWNR